MGWINASEILDRFSNCAFLMGLQSAWNMLISGVRMKTDKRFYWKLKQIPQKAKLKKLTTAGRP